MSLARRDAEGAVITDYRNFTTKNPKKGHNDDALFSKPDYVAVGDPYKNPGSLKMRESKKDGHKDAGHDMAFKPAKSIPRPVKADFEHKTDHVEKKKNYRDGDGAVIIENRNFLTNPPKKGLVGKG